MSKITVHAKARQLAADELEHKYVAEFKELYIKHIRKLLGIKITDEKN